MRDMGVIAEAVVKNLSQSTTRGDMSIITTPILAYGHTFVPVHLAPDGNGVLVSDGGFARREVSMMGGDAYFGSNAHRVAARYGIGCDGDLFFSVEGHDEIDAVTAAVAAVANAAKDTIETVAERIADRAIDGARDQVLTTLRATFGKGRVVTGSKARLIGAQEEWDFDAVVQGVDAALAVLIVSPYSNSVTTAFSKFSDIKNSADVNKKNFGVLTDTKSTPRLRLIHNVATLVPIERSTKEFWRATAVSA